MQRAPLEPTLRSPLWAIAWLLVAGVPTTVPSGVWACQLPVCTAVADQDVPVMVSDGAGGALIAWRDFRNGVENAADIFVQRVVAGMAIAPGWPANGTPATQALATQTDFRMAPDGSGGAFLVWFDYRDGLINGTDIYAQHVLGDGTIAPGWPADGLAVCTEPGWQVYPTVAADGSGGAFLVWEDYRASGGGPGGSDECDIYAVRVLANGTLAPGWVANGIPVCDVPGQQVGPEVMGDGAGGAIVTWGDGRNFAVTGGDVYAGRIAPNGTTAPGWPAGGVVLSAVPGPQGAYMRLVPDGAGGAIVAWVDFRAGLYFSDADLFGQRVRADGTLAPGWPAAGLAICLAPDLQQNLDMVADGAGGAVIVWEDYRGSESDVFGLRITGAGAIAPGWTVDGTLLAGGPGYQYTPRAAPDGFGGVLLAFTDLRGGNHDLRAQRVLLDGTRPGGWPLEGLALCPGPRADLNLAAVGDGAGGLIVAANHAEVSVSDIYAAFVTVAGPTPVLVALASVEAEPERARLTWYGAEAAGLAARVERRTETSDWETLAELTGDGAGMFRYEDRGVTPGARYAYRLAYFADGVERFSDPAWVTVPRPEFALHGAQPNPVAGDLMVGFSLPSGEPARLEVYDLAGRQVLAREVGGLGAGRHALNAAPGERLAAGVYHLVLAQGARRAVVRAVVVR